MTDPGTTEAAPFDKIWRARPLILATIGALAAIVIQQLTDRNPGYPSMRADPGLQRPVDARSGGTAGIGPNDRQV